jgi:hypothetical protein
MKQFLMICIVTGRYIIKEGINVREMKSAKSPEQTVAYQYDADDNRIINIDYNLLTAVFSTSYHERHFQYNYIIIADKSTIIHDRICIIFTSSIH